jgi:hypothetical protein
MRLLTLWPPWLAALLLVGLTTLLATLGPIVVRRRVALARLSTNNEVAGFKFATVGVLYAVLLAFAVVVVWEKFSEAEAAVAQEAGAAATIYRLSDGFGADAAPMLRSELSGYIRITINRDWPALAHGHGSPEAVRALSVLYAILLTFHPTDSRGDALLKEVLHQLDVITAARVTRLVLAGGVMPGIVWIVLFGGAFLTVGFTFFFGTQNLRAQTLMTCLLALLIFSGLFVIVEIDYPFTGSVKVEPHALSLVLEDFGDGHAM